MPRATPFFNLNMSETTAYICGCMSVIEAKDYATRLRQQINTHNHAYYVIGQPTVTDAEYDLLFRDLKALEDRWPQTRDPNSPTCRVGSQVMYTFQKVNHDRKMLSLDNAYSAEEVVKFFASSQETIGEPKIDGLSLSLHYKSGHLIRAITRGDGTTGDDVTTNAKTIRSIPLELSLPLDTEVRGEVYMPISVFESLNKELEQAGEDLFANPRNAAAGTLKQKDSRVVAKRNLGFIAYNVGSPIKLVDDIARRIGQPGVKSHKAVLVWLGTLGFITPMRCPGRSGWIDFTRTVPADAAGLIDEIIKDLGDLRETLDFQTDGLVFKINDLNVQSELGDGTRSPKWATAYKYPPERKPTLLKRIEVSIGRLGTLTPVAILEPVQLSGTTVERASLCNQDEVQRLGIDIGDTVYVEKSAEIIPKVMGLAKKGKNASFWLMPKACPSCGSPVIKDISRVAYRCPNTFRCPAQAIERLKHALGKPALDWDGMGEETVKWFVEKAKITTLSGLMEVTPSWVDTHLSKAAAKKFLKERERVKSVPLWRKSHALGISGIGKTASQDLCARFKSILDMHTAPGEVCRIVGEVHGKSFYDFVTNNVDEIEKLDSLGLTFAEPEGVAGPLSGKTFCITGVLVSGKRGEVEARIMQAGGAVKSSVTKKVQFLIVGEGGGANKAEGARKNGTAIITEEQLYSLLNEPMPITAKSVLEERGEV